MRILNVDRGHLLCRLLKPTLFETPIPPKLHLHPEPITSSVLRSLRPGSLCNSRVRGEDSVLKDFSGLFSIPLWVQVAKSQGFYYLNQILLELVGKSGCSISLGEECQYTGLGPF